MKSILFFSLACCLLPWVSIAQNYIDSTVTISGQIVDALTNEPIPGVIITHGSRKIESPDGTFSATFTVGITSSNLFSRNGKKVLLKPNRNIEFSHYAYQHYLYKLSKTANELQIKLFPNKDNSSIGKFGDPLDRYNHEDIVKTGQLTGDKALHFLVPAFNSTNHPISDATAHYDPADLRNLGPSRTLVLINGKRKNASPLVYVNDTPAKGEVGVDTKSIPFMMLKEVEVLRDGASARFGSDAIAGVINFKLRDALDVGQVHSNFYSGINTTGDGLATGFDFFSGMRLGKRGFFNVSNSFYYQDDAYKSAQTQNTYDYRYPAFEQKAEWKDWLKNNPDMGIRFGQPKLTMNTIFYNTEIPLNDQESIKFYSFGGITQRQGTSMAIYRAPYVEGDPHYIFHTTSEPYQGFQPNFNANILDNYFTFGTKYTGSRRWDYDLSFTTGKNQVDYTVENSYNNSIGINNPRTFRPGGYVFSTGIADFSAKNTSLKFLTFVFGSQFRIEQYTAKAGDQASSQGQGLISFPGIRPEDAISASRYNFSSFVDALFDFKKIANINIIGRIENYSDYGLDWSGKFEVFRQISDNWFIRGAVSKCFRAPALHQRYFSATQTLSLLNQGTFNNESPVVRFLGVDNLNSERSFNYSIGIGGKIGKFLTLDINLYQIDLKNRILYSSSISDTLATSNISKILSQYSISSLKFFANAIDSKHQGIDFSINSKRWEMNKSAIKLSYAFTLSRPTLLAINAPKYFEDNKINIIDRKEISRLLYSRPNTKHIAIFDLELLRFILSLRGTWFGSVRSDYYRINFSEEKAAKYDQKFNGKFVTDFSISTSFFDNQLYCSLFINNIFDIFPDPINYDQLQVPYGKGNEMSEINLGGRFKYLRDVSQFGYNGRNVSIKIGYRFR